MQALHGHCHHEPRPAKTPDHPRSKPPLRNVDLSAICGSSSCSARTAAPPAQLTPQATAPAGRWNASLPPSKAGACDVATFNKAPNGVHFRKWKPPPTLHRQSSALIVPQQERLHQALTTDHFCCWIYWAACCDLTSRHANFRPTSVSSSAFIEFWTFRWPRPIKVVDGGFSTRCAILTVLITLKTKALVKCCRQIVQHFVVVDTVFANTPADRSALRKSHRLAGI